MKKRTKLNEQRKEKQQSMRQGTPPPKPSKYQIKKETP